MVRTFLGHWYEKERCALCGAPFGTTPFLENMPGFLDAEGRTFSWSAVSAERLPEVLRTHRPICHRCHDDGISRGEHPEVLSHRLRKSARDSGGGRPLV
jgi:hypothetical protein